MNMISIINLASVGVLGLILSARFCDIQWTRLKILSLVGTYCGADYHIATTFHFTSFCRTFRPFHFTLYYIGKMSVRSGSFVILWL